MHWSITARREFDRIFASRGVIIYGIIATLTGIFGLQVPSPTEVRIAGNILPIGSFQVVSHYVMPVAAILFGYRAIVKERDSGTIRFTLGVPQSRFAVITGIFVGRFAALALVTLCSYLTVTAVGTIQYGAPPVVPFFLFPIPILLALAAHLAVGVGVSAVSKNSTRAASVALIYSFVSIFWIRWLAVPLYEWLSGQAVNPFSPPPAPGLFLLQRILPVGASHVATNWVLGVGNAATNFGGVMMDAQGEITNSYLVSDAFRSDQVGLTEAVSTDVPMYLHPVSGLLILLIWCICMITVSHFIFERSDVIPNSGKSGRSQGLSSAGVQLGERLFRSCQLTVSRSWMVTAHREWSRLSGTRGLLFYGIFLVAAGMYYLNPPPSVENSLGSAVTIGVIQQASALITLAAALIFGYRAISNERESGTITISVGVPQSRGEYLIGVVMGRFVPLAAITLCGYYIIATIGSLQYGLVPLGQLLLISCAGLLYLAANFTLAIGLSSLTRQNSRSAAPSFVYFIFMGIFWVTLFAPLLFRIITGSTLDLENPPHSGAFLLLQRSTPYGAFNVTTNWILGIGNSATEYTSLLLGNTHPFSTTMILGNEVPFYLHPISGPVILTIWCVASLSTSYIKLQRGDLV